MAEFSVFQMFATGGCRICDKPVRGTANKKRHLRTHEELTETRDGWLLAPEPADEVVIDLMARLQESLSKGRTSSRRLHHGSEK